MSQDSATYLPTQHYGSSAFAGIADLFGISIDVANFVICQIVALLLASLFRTVLHPSKVATSIRHIVALTVGLAMSVFCYGSQTIHIAVLPLICYIIIRTQRPQVVQRYVVLVAMLYLLNIHMMRLMYGDGTQALDVSGPLMVITQKVTSLAISIHEDVSKPTKELTKGLKYHAIQKVPSLIEYFSYIFNFHSLMAGPFVLYKDYIEFIEGSNFLKANNQSNLDKGKVRLVIEPSPTPSVIQKCIGSFVCAFIYIKFIKLYPVKNMTDDEFLNTNSIFYKLWYVMLSTTIVRFKYYHAWLLAEAICNNSGLGFNGYDKEGNANWNLISNINVFGFEFATSIRDAIKNWNCGTNHWLRSMVYERIPKQYATFLTFALSAVWHGFYPGYYLTFATGALMVSSARTARRLFRHRFQHTKLKRIIYDILTFLATRVVMAYTTFPFVVLEFTGSIKLYLKFYVCLHVFALIVMCVLPKFIKESKSNISSSDVVADMSNTSIDKLNDSVQLNSTINRTSRGQCNNINIKDNLIVDGFKSSENEETSKKSKLHDNSSKLPNRICDRTEMDHDTKSIEEFLDETVTKTVNGIIDFKNDLMNEQTFTNQLRKRIQHSPPTNVHFDTFSHINCGKTQLAVNDSGAFLKKDIEVINTNVLPAVFSNTHAKY